ncbi:hypothetical protein D358_02255 [Enterococcus faecalis RP2S-4]|nr:hypothetical protein D358_02255 [Enterococcus faecalis RP2S-4]
MRKNPCYTTNSFVNFNVKNNVFVIFVNKLTFLSYKNSKKFVYLTKRKLKNKFFF